MTAKEIIRNLKPDYVSGESNIQRDFFSPCMKYCSEYSRAVAYFSSSALVSWSDALPKIVTDENVHVCLLIEPVLSDKDKEALEAVSTEDERQDFLQRFSDKILLRAIKTGNGKYSSQFLRNLLSWMVATERLEIRFAYARHVEKAQLFHKKVGVFQFPWGDKVAFTGSANETISGHQFNYEEIDVFRSWEPTEEARVKRKEELFVKSWNNEATGLTVVQVSKEALDKVRRKAPGTMPMGGQKTSGIPRKKWIHQDEAIDIFLTRERGILEMATGTGKTRTALRIMVKLMEKGLIDTIIVGADGTSLLEQWYREILSYIGKFPKKLAVYRHFERWHDVELFSTNPVGVVLLASRPIVAGPLKRLNNTQGEKTLLVHDEVHKAGSPVLRNRLNGLSEHIRFRLGLSATPDREYDEEGSKFVLKHLGPVIYHFGLKEAIQNGVLCPFNYYPLNYTISLEEKKKIQQVIASCERRRKQGEHVDDEEIYRRIAQIHKTSPQKLPVFNEFIKNHKEFLQRCIIFVETKEYGEKVLELVHKYRYDFHTFFGEDEEENLERFATGELECLITCHRLSEGIDIRSLKNVILFSSSRARLETIQRIGRCLRTDPQNTFKVANVVDFIRGDPDNADQNNSDTDRRDWLSELSEVRPE